MNRLSSLSFVLALSAASTQPALAQSRSPSTEAGSPQAAAETETTTEEGHWSLGATLFAGPFEEFPQGGLALDGLLHVSPRLRLGARGTFYAPRTYANVHRNALTWEGLFQGTLLDSKYVDWYGAVGLGVGVFHDDYIRVYEDVTRYVPGISVATGAEWQATHHVRPFVGLGARAYFTDAVTDSQWLELSGGVRVVF
jgi:hypothetical protein